jgi:hypothetical protein
VRRAWGQINDVSCLRSDDGFQSAPEVDARQKENRSARVGDCKAWTSGPAFDGLAGLQSWTDADRAARAGTDLPATGLSVAASWEAEKRSCGRCRVLARAVRPGQDAARCTRTAVHFEGQLCPPVPYAGRVVEVRGCSGRVQISIRRPPWCWSRTRGTQERILIDPACEGRDRGECSRPSRWGRWPGSRRSPRCRWSAAGGPLRRGWRRWHDDDQRATHGRSSRRRCRQGGDSRPGTLVDQLVKQGWTSRPRPCRRS